MKKRLLRTLFLGWWLLAASGGGAQTLALRDYNLASGLPQTMVYAICQDGQGRLWAGTQGGICVFDGQKFRTLTTAQGLPDNHVKAVAAAPDGTLWLGHNYGGVSVIRPNGQLRRCRPRGLGTPTAVLCVLPATSKTVWVATMENGLFRLECGPADTAVTHYGLAEGLPSLVVRHVAAGPAGRVWVATAAGLVLLDPRGGPATPLPAEVQGVPVTHMQRVNDTLLWCATSRGIVRLSGNGSAARPWRARRYGLAEGLCAAGAMRVLQDRAGNVWTTTAAGLSQLPNTLAAHAAAVAGLPSLDQAFLRRMSESVLRHLADEAFGVDELQRFSGSCTWRSGGTSPPAPLQKRGEPDDQYTHLRTALGADIGMSRTQIHRKLKALTGQSPGEHIRGTRLHRALALLQAQVGTVAEVSY